MTRPVGPAADEDCVSSVQATKADGVSFLKRAGEWPPFLAALVAIALAAPPAPAAPLDYHADIAPILRDYCSGCHNETDYDGDFSVETFRALSEGGESDDEKILVPGQPARSFLLRTLRGQADPSMPPEKEPQPSEEELALIARWIKEGAKGPPPEEDESILATLHVPEVPAAKDAARPVTAAELSPDGKLLALARFGEIELLDAKTREVLRRIPDQEGKVNAVHFTPDGEFLVIATGIAGLRGVAAVHAVATGQRVREIGGDAHRDILFDAEISPDGKLLATAGYDRVIRIWEFASGKHLRQLPSHNGAVFDLAFSPDSRLLLSASGDSTGKVWDVTSGERLDTLNQPLAEQFRIGFTPDGKFILGAGADNRVRLWRLLSREAAKINPVVHARFAHEDDIGTMAVSRDGKWLATASADRALKLWRLPAVELVRVLPEQPDVVASLAFLDGDRRFLVGRMDGSVEEYPVVEEGKGEGGEKLTKGGDQKPAKSRTGEGKGKRIGKRKGVPADKAVAVELPAKKEGHIAEPGERDLYRFAAKKGEEWIFEVEAARKGSSLESKLDSKIEVLTPQGEPVERVVLQAVRDSWFTFRGKNSDIADDFRIHNWREMELNEYLYANGEVVKLWHYPRGPDSGYKVYPGYGKRRAWFDTTPLAHALGEPCYIVRSLPAGSDPSPNGLPLFRVFYENDDDASRRHGSDSVLTFTAPADGDYLLRISDVRGFGGEDYRYTLHLRKPRPDFSVAVKIEGKKPAVSPGSGQEISFTADRRDGFDGEIRLAVGNLPPGFTIRQPLSIQAGQDRAYAVLRADRKAEAAAKGDWEKVRVTATARIAGKDVTRDLGSFGEVKLAEPAKILAEIKPDGKEGGRTAPDGLLELEIEPGETISALVEVARLGHEERITFGKDDSGRNLPHGLYVDNIGLNGLMIPPGKNEQRFFITADDWVPGTERLFHLRTNEAGKQATKPVRIRVVE